MSLTWGFKAEGERGLSFQSRQLGARESFIDPTVFEYGFSFYPVLANSSPNSKQWQGGGFEPGTSGLQIQHPNHYAMLSP